MPRKPIDIVFYVIIIGLLVVGVTAKKQVEPVENIEQLQAQVQQLQADMEDVKLVQGKEILNQIKQERERRMKGE